LEEKLKKIALIVMVLLLIGGTAAFADHPDGLGIGVISGGSVGLGGFGFGGVDLSLKLPDIPIYWGINLNFGNYFGLGVSGDYFLIDDTFLSEGIVDLAWYLGVGAYANLVIGDEYFGLAVGGRLPIGLSLQLDAIPDVPLEIFLQAVPSIGLAVLPDPDLDFYVPLQAGIRIWL
jgi:hypothetical protein